MNIEEVVKTLEELANKITPAAQHVFDLALRQIIIENIIAAIASALVLIGGTILLVRIYNKSKKGSDDHQWGSLAPLDDPVFLLMFGVTPTVTAMLLAFFFIIGAIPVILNPEWAVLIKLSTLVP